MCSPSRFSCERRGSVLRSARAKGGHNRPAARTLVVLTLLLLFGITACGGEGVGGIDSDIRYAAIGASDATGIGAEPLSQGYVYRIQRKLEDEGKSTALFNLGIPGIEIDRMEDDETVAAANIDPDLVTIFAGPNDIIGGRSPEDFENHLKDIFQKLHQGTQAFIVVATIPDMTQAPRFQSDPDPDVTAERVSAYNEAILREAAAFQISVADLRNLPTGPAVTSGDGFHPNNAGYERIAQIFLAVIEPHFLTASPRA